MNPYAAKEIALGLLALYRADTEAADEHFAKAVKIVNEQADRRKLVPPPNEVWPMRLGPTVRIILHAPGGDTLVDTDDLPREPDRPHVELPAPATTTPAPTARPAEKPFKVRRRGTSP